MEDREHRAASCDDSASYRESARMKFSGRHPQLPRLWRLEQLECVNGAATGSIRVAGGPLNVGRPAGTVSLAPLGC